MIIRVEFRIIDEHSLGRQPSCGWLDYQSAPGTQTESSDSELFPGESSTISCLSHKRTRAAPWGGFWKELSTLKLRLLGSLVLPVLLYGSATWTLSAESCNLVDAFHRKCLRRILKIRWFHRVTNDRLYALSENPAKASTIIRKSNLRLLGHIARLDERTPAWRILHAASSTEAPHGWRRPRGRPQLSLTSQVSEILPLRDTMRLARDRRAFRELVATVT